MLTEQIAVQDLIALGDFLSLPDDDLALASVLKSPLFGLDDDDLMALAHGAQGLAVGGAARSRDRRTPASRARPRPCSAGARGPSACRPSSSTPSVLDGEGGRARMLARLGAEAADAIDEFLNLALAYDDGAPPSLQGFLAWLREGRREVKRDMEQGRNEVRVMTVHGAKGLEAPIVFLPDTCSTRSARLPNGLLILDDAERPSDVPPPFLWPVKGTSKVGAVQQRQGALIAAAETEERNRLLYVALTRARDRLYVAGFEGVRGAARRLLVQSDQGRPRADDCRRSRRADGRTVWRLASEQTAKPEPAKSRGAASCGDRAAAVLGKTKAPREPLLTMPLVPSRLAPLEMEAEEAVPAGTSQTPAPPSRRSCRRPRWPRTGRFLRGTLTHALLEHLPGLPRRTLARRPPRPSWPPAPPSSRRETRKRHRRRDAGRAAGPGVGAAVRPGQPRRGGDCRRGAASAPVPAPSCA